ncbi:MAG: hypothetical protein HY390_02765, partial [Deltaproteobacteria bacterium]|nr:hypothetical protein [Deltaproteobacteria bacterium]
MKLNLFIGVMVFLLLPWLEVHEVLGEMEPVEENVSTVSLAEEFHLPMDGKIISVSKLKEQLLSKWGDTVTPCMNEFLFFIKLWNENQTRNKKEIAYQFTYLKDFNEFKKRTAAFETCATASDLITEHKELEAALNQSNEIGSPNSAIKRGPLDHQPIQNHSQGKRENEKESSSNSIGSSISQLGGGRSFEADVTRDPAAFGSSAQNFGGGSSAISSQGSTSIANIAGTLARNSSSGNDRGLIGSTAIQGPAEYEGPGVQKEKTEIEVLRKNYENISAFGELEERKMDILTHPADRRAELDSIEKEMAERRVVTKDALLSVFRNKGLSRKERLNAYWKWSHMEDEDRGGISSEVYKEAIDLIAEVNREYEQGLQKAREKIQTASSIQEYVQACQMTDTHALQKILDFVEKMPMKEIAEQAGVTFPRPKLLTKDLEQSDMGIMLNRKSRDP